ncbi:MAG TPA: 1-(5-phosphoribosyl)-5-amino-4-imidazole-carboxylate carboxylase, partial [Bacilli bacterium]
MNSYMKNIEQILKDLQSGVVDVKTAQQQIMELQVNERNKTIDLGFAKLDVDREKRTGFPEVIFGEGKTVEQLIMIFQKLQLASDKILATRVNPGKAEVLMNAVTGLTYHPGANAVTWFKKPILKVHAGYVAVVCAGTSDLPVAEEAALTIECMESHVEKIYDV